jgi:hypothetical protein
MFLEIQSTSFKNCCALEKVFVVMMLFPKQIAIVMAWTLPSRAAFTNFATTLFENSIKHHEESGSASGLDLFNHQKIARAFLNTDGPYRGLVLFHGLGSGKSCSSIVAAEAILTQGMKAAVFLPASLHMNFVDEVTKCGRDLYRKTQSWKSISVESTKFTEECERLGLDPKVVKRRRGVVWIPQPVSQGGIAFKSLESDQQRAIGQQLDEMIHASFSFFHYNGGLSESKLDEMLSAKEHPLADHVIVIDEVHGLVSRAVGSGVTGKKMYQLLVTAPRAKIIALSGTPLINYPEELAYLIGLVKGYSPVFTIAYSETTKAEDLLKALQSLPDVDLIDVRDGNQKFAKFTRLPLGFCWKDQKDRTAVTKDDSLKKKNDQDFIQDTIKALQTVVNDVNIRSIADKTLVAPLPLDPDVFRGTFIDEEYGAVLHKNTLANRMMGCISYFDPRGRDEDLYPSVKPLETVHTTLSSHQWLQYEEVRMKERTMEDRSKRMRGMKSGQNTGGIFSESQGVHRTFSRAVGNFAFPKNIRRPWPSSMREMLEQSQEEEDKENEEEAEAQDPGEFKLQSGGKSTTKKQPSKEAKDARIALKKEAKASYQLALAKAILQIKQGSFLNDEGLAECSPKFVEIIKRLNKSPGTALVYSTFRHVEGLAMLTLALELRGWSEFRLFKGDDGEWDVETNPNAHGLRYVSFDSDKDKNRIALAVFNSQLDALPPKLRKKVEALSGGPEMNLKGHIIKLMEITSSGAQGISLKNVRQVHILEPYWNQNRIDQVIGRAVRANSHKDLPKQDRTVEVFMYVATLDKKSKESSATIRIKDNGMTSDEHIVSIAKRKSDIMEQLYDIMKKAAVDCKIWSATACHNPPALANDGLLHGLDVISNAANEDRMFGTPDHRKLFVGAKEIRYKGKLYVYHPLTKKLYDSNSFKTGRFVEVGKVLDDGKSVHLI